MVGVVVELRGGACVKRVSQAEESMMERQNNVLLGTGNMKRVILLSFLCWPTPWSKKPLDVHTSPIMSGS